MNELVTHLEEKARQLRVAIVKTLHASQSGHTGGSLSAIDMVTALYFHKMRHNPTDPAWEGRDRFVLCKGHAAPAQYVALAEAGYFPPEDLMTLRRLESHLQGHPDSKSTPGVEVPTGRRIDRGRADRVEARLAFSEIIRCRGSWSGSGAGGWPYCLCHHG